MTFGNHYSRLALGLMLGLLAPLATTGCQTTVGGQTLPSAYYLEDDVQYFQSGPEFILSNQEQALKNYQSEREAEMLDQ